MKTNKYLMIIFDLDGTFYYLDDVVAYNYKLQVDFYSEQKNLEPSEVEKIFQQNSILPYRSELSRSATEYFLKNGIDAESWSAYRNAHSPVNNINKDTAVKNELISGFSEYADLVLLSSNTIENIEKTLERLEIDRGLFSDIYCSSTVEKNCRFSKESIVPAILEKHGCSPEKALAVGDRYESDIKPLVNLGGDGVLVDGPGQLPYVYSDLVESALGSGDDRCYKFYPGV